MGVDVVNGAVRESRVIDATPSAKRLTSSLRDIGYDFVSAIADIVDNSVSAAARHVDIVLQWDTEGAYVVIADDGRGMSAEELYESLRFGSRRRYEAADLGRYGLGLKTASLSQCRRVTVVTRTAQMRARVRMCTLDLDHVIATDRWEVLSGPPDHVAPWVDTVLRAVTRGPGTVVVWDGLDRVLPNEPVGESRSRRRLRSLAVRLGDHLGMVFHRFIEDAVAERDRLVITVNGEKVRPWNPFAPDEPSRAELPPRRFEVWSGDVHGEVVFRPFVLPPRSRFSSQAEFDRLSGPQKWNRQQGLYIYRADRLIQSGGWCGVRAIDEHTKLGRAAVEFSPVLDELFRINVAKMRVGLPAEVRTLLEPEVADLCHRAEMMYRRDVREGSDRESSVRRPTSTNELSAIGLSLLAAAMATGTGAALEAMMAHLRDEEPDVLSSLGWA